MKAQRGQLLRCRGWRQESILRMLENNLENAESPSDLIIYKSNAKAARDWDSYHLIVKLLKELEENETLVIQSGKPVARFHTHVEAPLVVMANGNVVGAWSSNESVEKLKQKGLTVTPGMTAGAWQYIGSQGILQGTFETFMAVGRKYFNGSLAGRLIVTAGCGGMGGAQPLAGKMAGAIILVIDIDPRRIQRRIDIGYCDQMTESLDEAIKWCEDYRNKKTPISIGLVGNAAEVLPELYRRGIILDIVTDQTSTEIESGYYPPGLSIEETRAMRKVNPEAVNKRALEGIAQHVQAMLDFQRSGAIVFEYGNNIRRQAKLGGLHEAFEIPGFVEEYIRPFFLTGKGPFRWISITGEESDIRYIDQLVLEVFGEDHPVASWIRLASQHVGFQGLPARIGWLGHTERTRLALAVNQAIREGHLSGPIAFSRDHLDSGSVAFPYRETENMLDGSDAIADWPILNALMNCASGADLVAIHGLYDYAQSAGVTVIADGTKKADDKIQRVLTADTGMGVHRYADAGYPEAIAARKRFGLAIDETKENEIESN